MKTLKQIQADLIFMKHHQWRNRDDVFKETTEELEQDVHDEIENDPHKTAKALIEWLNLYNHGELDEKNENLTRVLLRNVLMVDNDVLFDIILKAAINHMANSIVAERKEEIKRSIYGDDCC